MNTEKTWSVLREVSDTLEFSEEPVVSLPDDPRELDALLARLAFIAAAVRWFQGQAKQAMGDHLGSRGFARFGPRVYRSAPKRTVKVRREVEGELWGVLEGHARRLFNIHSARITGLRDVAADYVDPDTGEIGFDAFEARFYDVETGDLEVKELPADKAPKFIAESEEGVHWRD